MPQRPLVCFTWLAARTWALHQASLVLDGTAASRRFDGHGALSAGASSRLLFDYPEKQRSQVLDVLFLPNFAASLQILKVEIGGDHQSTEGTEPSHMHSRGDLSCRRGYELWLVAEAKKRNPDIKIYAMAWTAPGWVGYPGNLYSNDGVGYLVEWMKCVVNVTGFAPDFAGLWNEQTQPSADYVIKLRQTMDMTSVLKSTKLIVMDGPHFDDAEVATAKVNAAYKESVFGAGLHYPCWRDQATWSNQSSLVDEVGWNFWASEDNAKTPDWQAGGTYLGKALNQNFVAMNLTSTVSWSLIWAEYDNQICAGAGLMLANEPWSGSYNVTAPIWMLAHTTQFASPGWRYLSVESGSSGFLLGSTGHMIGTFVSLVPPSCLATGCSELTLVLETLRNDECLTREYESASLTVSLRNFRPFAGTRLRVWRTTNISYFEQVEDVLVGDDGAFELLMLPDSIVTISTGISARHGSFEDVPTSRSFPVPYTETFDDYASDSMVHLFSDQGGSWAARDGLFQNVADGGASNNSCLPEWDPITVVGSPNLTDYGAEVDVVFMGSQLEASEDQESAPAAPQGTDERPRTMSPTWSRWQAWNGGRVIEPPSFGGRAPATRTAAPPVPYGKLCGRISAFPGFNWNHVMMPGYCLALTSSGAWSLTQNETVVVSGMVGKFDAALPHRLGLNLHGSMIEGYVDGNLAGRITDRNFSMGNIALGSSYGGNTAFDNFQLTKSLLLDIAI